MFKKGVGSFLWLIALMISTLCFTAVADAQGDDYLSLQQLIDLAPEGGTVTLESRTYFVSKAPTIKNKSMTLEGGVETKIVFTGQGVGASDNTNAALAVIFDQDNTSEGDVLIKNIAMDLMESVPTNSTGTAYGATCKIVDTSEIINHIIFDGVTINNSSTRANYRHGITINEYVPTGQGLNNYFDVIIQNSTLDTKEHTVSIGNAGNEINFTQSTLKVLNSDFQKNVKGWYGIHSPYNIKSLIVQNSNFYDYSKAGIKIQEGSNSYTEIKDSNFLRENTPSSVYALMISNWTNNATSSSSFKYLDEISGNNFNNQNILLLHKNPDVEVIWFPAAENTVNEGTRYVRSGSSGNKQLALINDFNLVEEEMVFESVSADNQSTTIIYDPAYSNYKDLSTEYFTQENPVHASVSSLTNRILMDKITRLEIEDPSVAEFERQEDGTILITPKGVGRTRLLAVVGGGEDGNIVNKRIDTMDIIVRGAQMTVTKTADQFGEDELISPDQTYLFEISRKDGAAFEGFIRVGSNDATDISPDHTFELKRDETAVFEGLPKGEYYIVEKESSIPSPGYVTYRVNQGSSTAQILEAQNPSQIKRALIAIGTDAQNVIFNNTYYPEVKDGDTSTECQLNWLAQAVMDIKYPDYSNKGYTYKIKKDIFDHHQGRLEVQHWVSSNKMYWRIPLATDHDITNGEFTVTLPSDNHTINGDVQFNNNQNLFNAITHSNQYQLVNEGATVTQISDNTFTVEIPEMKADTAYLIVFETTAEGGGPAIQEGNRFVTNAQFNANYQCLIGEKKWVDTEPVDIQLQLEQNGQPYEDPVTLKIGTHIWNRLPIWDDQNEKYVYDLKEQDPSDLYLKTKEVTQTDNKTHITITNSVVGLSLLKTDENNQPLAGAVFGLYEKDGTTLVREYTTLEDGTVALKPLQRNGHYVLREQSAPDGFVVSNERYQILVDDEGVVEVIGNEGIVESNPLHLVNRKTEAPRTKVIVHKTWVNLKPGDLPENYTATFTIQPTGQVKTVTGNGTVVFNDLLQLDESGNEIVYTVEESPVDGFKSLKAGNPQDGFVFINIPEQVFGVVLQKLDQETNQVLQGATFELWKNADTLGANENRTAFIKEQLATVRAELSNLRELDKEGAQVEIERLEKEKADLESQITALKSSDSMDAENERLTLEEALRAIEMQIDERSDEINKSLNDDLQAKRSDLEEKISELEATLDRSNISNEDQLIGTYDTNEVGLLIIGNLEAGDYFFKEIKAPSNYEIIGDGIYEFSVPNPEEASQPIVLTVKNRPIPMEKINIDVVKKWEDRGQNISHPTITIKLYDGDQLVKQAQLANGQLEHRFTNLDKYRSDRVTLIEYRVEEEAVVGYQEPVITGNMNDGFTITNTKKEEPTPDPVKETIKGNKTWKNDKESDRPESITVILYQDGKEVDRKVVTKANGWAYDFGEWIIKESDGTKHVYTVKEMAVDGYESVINGYHITNTKMDQPTPDPEKETIKGIKTWKNDKESDRPESITVILYQDGKEVDRKVVTKANGWAYDFGEWIIKESDGTKHVYTIQEIVPKGYSVEVDGYHLINTKKATPVKPDPVKPDPEKPAKPKPEKPSKPSKPAKPGINIPKTGDLTVLAWMVIGAAAIGTGTTLYLKEDRKKRK